MLRGGAQVACAQPSLAVDILEEYLFLHAHGGLEGAPELIADAAGRTAQELAAAADSPDTTIAREHTVALTQHLQRRVADLRGEGKADEAAGYQAILDRLSSP